jgi:signal transduction histidine kinase
MQKSFRQIIWSREMLLVAGFYAAFAVFYFLAINWSSGISSGDSYYQYQVFMDYPLKGLLTLPIWWLMFRRLVDWRLSSKILLHLLLLPIFVKGWQQLYYTLCTFLGVGYLRGPGEWWDIYIPALFYVLQFGIFHTYDYYKKVQESQQREAMLKQTALQSELTALKAQLNPHFLYNTFNTISASVPPEQEYTRELIADLADLFRYQLWASNQEVVPLKVEVDFVKKYLQLEQARFGDRLQVKIHLDPHAEDAPVIPMLLQPLVENALRHGISPLVDGGSIMINIEEKEGQIHISICDTGIGFSTNAKTSGQGIGLGNTRRRLQLKYGSELAISPNQPQGTTIHITIPKEAYHAESNSH